jgi:hypothetical protein
MRSWMAGLVAAAAIAMLPAAAAAAPAAETVRVQRANYWEDSSGRYLSVQGYTTDATVSGTTYTGPQLTAIWRDADGNPIDSAALAPVLDTAVTPAVYKYHSSRYRLGDLGDGSMPASVEIASANGGSDTLAVQPWASGHGPLHPPGYIDDFNTHYTDPREAYKLIGDLAAEFPELADVVNLPSKTGGYQRKAQTVLGISAPYNGATGTPNPADQSRAVVLTSNAFGQDGGNDITARLVDPGTASAPLSVSVNGKAITVQLATDSTGAVTSTAAQVVSAINGNFAATQLVTATKFRANAGNGVVTPQPSASTLSDWLNAPVTYPRGPQTVQMLRIGAHRDGSRLGVFMYCGESGREWMTPLVCLETAQRLLRNYATDPATKALLDGLEIFIVPSVNPDGGAYSMYDSSAQSRTMTNSCASDLSDPYARNTWGAEVGRNSSAGSIFDGFLGGSASCTSDLFAGPSEFSEPETRNEQWVESTFPNIRFALDVRSSEGAVTVPPGAEKGDGTRLPDPGYGAQTYFAQVASAIAARVHRYRNTAILPNRAGPMVDVLGSAAGNSVDEAYYNHGIAAFELDMGVRRTLPGGSSIATGVQPCFGAVGTGGGQGSCPSNGSLVNEGHDEGMEFADGAEALLQAALDYADDTTPPTSEASGSAVSQQAQQVRFTTSEPAGIFYTTDGSTPTTSSTAWAPPRPNALPEPVTIDRNTTLKWIAVDFKGNSAMQAKRFVIDAVAPAITFTQPATDGATFEQGQPVTLSFSCTDEADGSGVASCTGSPANGAHLDTSKLGTFSYSVTARDAAGNERTATRSYTVKAVPAPPVVTPTPTPVVPGAPAPPAAPPAPLPRHGHTSHALRTASLHGHRITYRLRRQVTVRARLQRRRGYHWDTVRMRSLYRNAGIYHLTVPRGIVRVVLTAGSRRVTFHLRSRSRHH